MPGKELAVAAPVSKGVQILDEQKPASFYYSHELGRCLKPESLNSWGNLLRHIGNTLIKARLDVIGRIPTRPQDLRISLIPIEQLNALAHRMESLRDILDVVLARPITGKTDDLDLEFRGLVAVRQNTHLRLQAQFSSPTLQMNREEIGGHTELIPGIPPYSRHAPRNPSQGIVILGRFNKLLPAEVVDAMVNVSEIEGLPSYEETMPVGPIQNIPLATMQNRIIRPDFAVPTG